MFEVSCDGCTGGIDKVFPEWGRYDRFGILIQEVWGAVGASLLIQAAVAEFFRARRNLGLSDIYPEIYAFHIGRDFGNMSVYDFWPSHKEVVVECHPTAVLQSLNDRAITRLAVPVGRARRHDFAWPELAAAKDRIRTCIEYAASGIAEGGEVTIRATSKLVEENTQQTLDLVPVMHRYSRAEREDDRRWLGSAAARMGAVSLSETERARAIHALNVTDGCATETYRRVTLEHALSRLVA